MREAWKETVVFVVTGVMTMYVASSADNSDGWLHVARTFLALVIFVSGVNWYTRLYDRRRMKPILRGIEELRRDLRDLGGSPRPIKGLR